METRNKINLLESRQLELRAIMKASDEHALKCAKFGLNFKETYPDDWGAYEKARREYNENEEKLMALQDLLSEEMAHIEISDEIIVLE